MQPRLRRHQRRNLQVRRVVATATPATARGPGRVREKPVFGSAQGKYQLPEPRTQVTDRAVCGALATHPSRRALACVLTVPRLPATRCGAAHPASSLGGCTPGVTAAMCGQSQLRARGGAVPTRPTPRLRPSAKPKAPGSAPRKSSRTTAR
eukprot:scaffold50436_cov35-Phaeocystis_antarctica.AAC.1